MPCLNRNNNGNFNEYLDGLFSRVCTVLIIKTMFFEMFQSCSGAMVFKDKCFAFGFNVVFFIRPSKTADLVWTNLTMNDPLIYEMKCKILM